MGHARHVPCPELRATREVVLEREYPGALLKALGGNAVDKRLAYGDVAHLADPLVVPAAQPPHRLCREAPRLAAAQQDRQDAAHVHLSLKPLGDVGGAVDLAAYRAKRLGRFLIRAPTSWRSDRS